MARSGQSPRAVSLRDGLARRIAGVLSGAAVIMLSAGGLYYFVAAVWWLLRGEWPGRSLRELLPAVAAIISSRSDSAAVGLLSDASPGLLALLAAGACVAAAILLDPTRRPR